MIKISKEIVVMMAMRLSQAEIRVTMIWTRRRIFLVTISQSLTGVVLLWIRRILI